MKRYYDNSGVWTVNLPSPVQVQVPYDIDAYAAMVAQRNDDVRAARQRYAESAFRDNAKSGAGAVGAYQIMPITYKDYLSRGKGVEGDLLDPEYNRKVRDFAMGVVPRDLGDMWSDSDSEQVRLAKQYAGYNWGAGSLKRYLRKQKAAGVDISNSLDWLDGLPKETRDYVRFVALGEDVPDTSKTMDAYRKAWGKFSKQEFPEDTLGRRFDTGGLIEKYVADTIRRAMNEFRDGGFKPIKKRDDFSPSKIKQKIVDKFGQRQYPNVVNVHGDFSRMYWGRPLQDDILYESNYRPTKEGNPSARYYGVRDQKFLDDLVTLYNQQISDERNVESPIRVNPLLRPGETRVLDGYYARARSKKDPRYVGETFERHQPGGDLYDGTRKSITNYPLTDSVGALGNFTVSRGSDERGDYLSYYDLWDLNGFTSSTRFVENKELGKPYEIYDRIYGAFDADGTFHPEGEISPAVITAENTKAVGGTLLHDYETGGKIHIKPSKKGTFTAAAKKHGKSVQAFASQVLAHKENYSPAMVKKANFARNAAKWHGDGGLIERLNSVYGDKEAAIAAIRKLRGL